MQWRSRSPLDGADPDLAKAQRRRVLGVDRCPTGQLAARDRLGVLDDGLPAAVQDANPFHLTKHADSMLDECRRRVQNETLSHRATDTIP